MGSGVKSSAFTPLKMVVFPRIPIVSVVLREGMTLAGLGVVLGLALVYGLTRLLASLLFGVKASDPFAFAAVAGILTMVALVASVHPRKAGHEQSIRPSPLGTNSASLITQGN